MDTTTSPEWQRIVIGPSKGHMTELDSGWYKNEDVARSLLNEEYPEANGHGFKFRLRKRWVSAPFIVEDGV